MMRRETLDNLRWVSRKMDFHPNTQTIQQLTDSHIEALDLIASQGRKIVELEAAQRFADPPV